MSEKTKEESSLEIVEIMRATTRDARKNNQLEWLMDNVFGRRFDVPRQFDFPDVVSGTVMAVDKAIKALGGLTIRDIDAEVESKINTIELTGCINLSPEDFKWTMLTGDLPMHKPLQITADELAERLI